jgi:hypothetical protein
MAVGDGARMSDLTERDQISQPATDVVGSPLPGASPELPAIPAVSAGLGELAAPHATPAAEPATVPLTEPEAEPRRVSPLLRLWRLLAGVGALGAAWGFTVVILLLYNAAWGFVSGPQVLLARLGVGLAGLVAALWLAVAVIACLLAGSYCLMLGLTRRSW